MWLWLVAVARAQMAVPPTPTSVDGMEAFRATLPNAYDPARALWLLAVTDTPTPKRARDAAKRDTDGDGIRDWWDLCPYAPRGPDGDDWRVGCPADAVWDEFGAPDPAYQRPTDRDADGNVDDTDRCPQDPEDLDGFEDEDGCPDVDNDRDGIPDVSDRCPVDPETVNGFNDDDGCADAGVAALLQLDAPAPAPVAAPRVVQLPSVDAPLRTGASAPKDAAVVIGLERYAYLGVDVPYARRDADAFESFLVYVRGVPPDRIHLLREGSVEQIRAAVRAAGEETRAGGRVWVYFAGHGAASPTTRDRVLLGDDVRADASSFESRSIAVPELERLAGVGGGEVVVVLDTCFAGVGREGGALLAKRFAVPVYAAAPAASEWNATGPNELSGALDEVQHGAFTYFAVGALRGWADGELSGQRDGRVTAAEAQVYVARALRTRQVRDQIPQWVGSDGASVVLSTGTEVGPGL